MAVVVVVVPVVMVVLVLVVVVFVVAVVVVVVVVVFVVGYDTMKLDKKYFVRTADHASENSRIINTHLLKFR